MPLELTQGQTAEPLVFLMVDSSDHITGKTGLSPTVTLSKNGASFASPAGEVTEIGSGWYKVAGNATDSETLGSLILHAEATGADPVDLLYQVVKQNRRTASMDLVLAKTANLTDLNDIAAADVVTAMETNGSKLDHLWETTEDDGGVRRFTQNALEQGPSSDATAANQTTIITHLTDIKGTGFVKDTHSLPQCLTATGFSTHSASDVATVILVTPANKLATDVSGYVTYANDAPPAVGDIATAVWQDATAGDFTVDNSIGKSVYTSGNAPGAASGLLIAGTNASTTFDSLWITSDSGDALTISATGTGTGFVDVRLGGSGTMVGTISGITGTIETLDALLANLAIMNDTGAVVADVSNTTSTFKTDLAGDDSAMYVGRMLVLTSGLGAKQPRRITGFDTGTKFVTLASALSDAPSGSDAFTILGFIEV